MMTWLDKFQSNLLEVLYRADQPRDEKGRWTSGGGGAGTDDSKVYDWALNKFGDAQTAQNFTEWFGDSKVVDSEGNPLMVYHGTPADFSEFSLTGQRLPSLGYGYYFTPNPEIAGQYGDKIMPVYLKSESLLDWQNLTGDQRALVVERLETVVPPNEIAGYGEQKRRSFPDTEEGREEGREFFRQKQAETRDYYHDRAKPSVDRGTDPNQIDVVWMEPGLHGASSSDLQALAQRYDNQIAENLGFDGAKSGSEIVVFHATQIKSATGNIGTFDPNDPNITNWRKSE